jgi:hypothetical protein
VGSTDAKLADDLEWVTFGLADGVGVRVANGMTEGDGVAMALMGEDPTSVQAPTTTTSAINCSPATSGVAIRRVRACP